MKQPHLYLFVGYPGAGKTTIARTIEEATGAVHIWADEERLKMFGKPTHSTDESRQLYAHLNEMTDRFLAEGKSVIFDTNFNFRADRQNLTAIGAKNNAHTTVVWITTPAGVAKQRAVHDNNLRNGYEFPMDEAEFDVIASHLEPPSPDEPVVEIDGTHAVKQHVLQLLNL